MKAKSKNLLKYRTGVKLNYLTILETLGSGTRKQAICRCDCGNIKKFYISNIAPKPNARYTVSCGCKKNQIVSEKVSTHRMSKSKFYKRWRSMFDRTSPKYICAKDYVGISVCKRWAKFENFRADMFNSYEIHKQINGERQTTLDRINVYGNYEPNNCRWATFKQQVENRKPKQIDFYSKELEKLTKI